MDERDGHRTPELNIPARSVSCQIARFTGAAPEMLALVRLETAGYLAPLAVIPPLIALSFRSPAGLRPT
jgi:hypothetical protein